MKILAVDLGDARTGLALCDAGELLAYPAGVLHDKQRERVLQSVAQAARENRVGEVLLGYPKNRDNTLGERARISEEFAASLRALLDIPVTLWDERGTTLSAHTALNATNTRGKKRKNVVDEVAATILLDSYLSWRRAQGKPL